MLDISFIVINNISRDYKKKGSQNNFVTKLKLWKEIFLHTNQLDNSPGYWVNKLEKNDYKTIFLKRKAIRSSCDLKLLNKDIRKGNLIIFS